MARKPNLTKAQVVKALKDNNGVIQDAAIDLSRDRNTVAKYIRKHNLYSVIDKCDDFVKDRAKSVLYEMAFGEREVEKPDKDGGVVTYNPGPNIKALEIVLRMKKLYSPKESREIDISDDLGTFLNKLIGG